MTTHKFGILVGGGPAPGINSVIGAATIRSIMGGAEVLAIPNGFQWLMEGDTSRFRPLSIEAVSRIHFRGGSEIGTSRANPTKTPESLKRTLETLQTLELSGLITIGGDDTAYSALKLEEMAKGGLRFVHVPKTIDNDLALPYGIPTFGFQTARHLGVELIKNLMADARASARWYFAVTMGRKAGHLALGIGKASGATITLIPEEFQERPIRLRTLVDTLTGAIVKRLSQGRSHGVAVLAEGLAEHLAPEDLEGLAAAERDQHGHLRLAEIELGDLLKRAVGRQLKDYGVKMTIVSKDIGYELRCADPIPYDMEYTRDLGYSAAQVLLGGGNAVMVSIQNGRLTPIPFKEMLDPHTGRTQVRLVDVRGESFQIARYYMIRLGPEDFQETRALERCASVVGMSPHEFRERFGYLAGELYLEAGASGVTAD